MGLLELRTETGDRPMCIRTTAVDMVIQEEGDDGKFRTKIVLRSGDSGYCAESYRTVMNLLHSSDAVADPGSIRYID